MASAKDATLAVSPLLAARKPVSLLASEETPLEMVECSRPVFMRGFVPPYHCARYHALLPRVPGIFPGPQK